MKGILFDIGWTLNYPASGDWMLTSKCGEFDFASVPRERTAAAFAEAANYLEKKHLIFTEDEEYEQFRHFYAMIANALPELGASAAQIDEIAYDRTYNDANYIFYDDVYPELERLAGEYKLGIISDTYPSTRRILKSAGIYDFFQSLTLSCELGVYKPHSRMYEHAAANMGLPPKEMLFIDDCADNLYAAQAHGIQTGLIRRSNNPRKQNYGKMITALTEL
jgi:putative hydrolase of the HAD superfamily